MFVQEQLYALRALESKLLCGSWGGRGGTVAAPFRFYSGLKMLIFEDSY